MTGHDDIAEFRLQAPEHYEAYVEYSKLLRVWLVAYGIGAPILFLSNDSLWRTISAHDQAWLVAVMFLLGVFLQVSVAWLNKTTQWIIFSGKRKPSDPPTWLFTAARAIGRQFWIDVAADLVSILLFTVATGWLFKILLIAPK